MHKADAYIFNAINNSKFRSKLLDIIMLALTQLGEGWIILLFFTIVRYGIGILGDWYFQSVIMIASVGVICQVIKSHFPKLRPVLLVKNVNVIGERLTKGSLPSGHTATSFALATVFSSHWPQGTIAFYLLAFLIGISRIYVGAHFPIDVLCGLGIGLSLSVLLLKFIMIAPTWGITNPLMIIFLGALCMTLTVKSFGGYTYKMMYDIVKKRTAEVAVSIKGDKSLLKMLIKFGMVGAIGVIINMAIFMYLTSLNAHYLIAAFVSFTVAVTSNFVWNLRWTFKGRGNDKSVRRKYVTFVTISLINLGVNLITLKLLVESCYMDKNLAQLVAIAFVSVLNFVLNYLITFSEPRDKQEEGVVNCEASYHTNL